jgi:hypothetical protein
MATKRLQATPVVPRLITHRAFRGSSSGLFAALLLPVLLGWASVAEARITRIEITDVESPTFEGRRFGHVGAYEKLRGKAYGEVDRAIR